MLSDSENFVDSKRLLQTGTFEFTSRIQKGGALLSDMRQLVCNWSGKSDEVSPGRFVKNILPKATQARANDTYIRAFQPRFIAGSPSEAWRLCAALEECLPTADVARAFYYWITARAEPVLYRYVTEDLFEQSQTGITSVGSEDLARWINKTASAEGKVWSDVVAIKVARAVLAGLRDFGVLEGSSKKHISPGHLPLEAFSLVAFCLRKILHDSGNPTEHPDWRLFLLTPRSVDRLFLESHQHDWLDYQSAGGISRLEFPVETFTEYVRLVLDR